MKKLTPEILREFVDKIVVHHRVRIGVATKDNPATEEQKVEIFYNCVGQIDVPDVAKVPQVEVVVPIRKGVTACYSSSEQQVVNFCRCRCQIRDWITISNLATTPTLRLSYTLEASCYLYLTP